MKKNRSINILLILIFALFLFRGDDVFAQARGKAYDGQIKSVIQGLVPAMIMCYDENEGSYAGCDTMIIEKYYDGKFPEPPKCSYDEKYNIVISNDGKNYAIWADLVNVDGYWCVDSEPEGYGKLVLSDEMPTSKKAFCPKDGHYTEQKVKSNCSTGKDDIGLYSIPLMFLLAFVAILFILLEFINKYCLSQKFGHKGMLWIALLGVIIAPCVGIICMLLVGTIATFLIGLDIGIALFASLPVIVLLAYFCIKSLFNPYKNLISSSAIRKLSLLILFFDLLIFIIALIAL